LAIQTLLNRVPPVQGGPQPQLDPDGRCGPMTVAAIRKFQQKHVGFADGIVEPGKNTLAKLNQFDGAPGQAPPVGNAAPPPPPSTQTGAPSASLGAARSKIISVAKDMATPPPGKVSDLVTKVDPQSGRTVRAGWEYLKDFFDLAVSGWQPTHWKSPEILAGVQIPGKRIPQPGRSGISWCGIFATWVLIKAGLPVKWGLGKGINLPILADKGMQPGDVLVMKGGTVHHCIAISDDGATMMTVNGNSDNQSILIKPVQKSSIAYYYKVAP